MGVFALFTDGTAEEILIDSMPLKKNDKGIRIDTPGNISNEIKIASENSIKNAHLLVEKYVAGFQGDVRICVYGFSARIIGNSADLAFALAYVDHLYEMNLLKGKRLFPRIISATGVINERMHVCKVKGIKEKVKAAADAGAGMLFFPEENLYEIMSIRQDDAEFDSMLNACGMNLVPVKTLKDAFIKLGVFKATPPMKHPFISLLIAVTSIILIMAGVWMLLLQHAQSGPASNETANIKVFAQELYAFHDPYNHCDKITVVFSGHLTDKETDSLAFGKNLFLMRQAASSPFKETAVAPYNLDWYDMGGRTTLNMEADSVFDEGNQTVTYFFSIGNTNALSTEVFREAPYGIEKVEVSYDDDTKKDSIKVTFGRELHVDEKKNLKPGINMFFCRRVDDSPEEFHINYDGNIQWFDTNGKTVLNINAVPVMYDGKNHRVTYCFQLGGGPMLSSNVLSAYDDALEDPGQNGTIKVDGNLSEWDGNYLLASDETGDAQYAGTDLKGVYALIEGENLYIAASYEGNDPIIDFNVFTGDDGYYDFIIFSNTRNGEADILRINPADPHQKEVVATVKVEPGPVMELVVPLEFLNTPEAVYMNASVLHLRENSVCQVYDEIPGRFKVPHIKR